MPRSLRRCFVMAKLAAAEMGKRRTEPVVGRLDMSLGARLRELPEGGIEMASSLGMLGLRSIWAARKMRRGQLVAQRHPLGARCLRPWVHFAQGVGGPTSQAVLVVGP